MISRGRLELDGDLNSTGMSEKSVKNRVSSKHELDEQTRTNYEQLFVRVCSQISAN